MWASFRCITPDSKVHSNLCYSKTGVFDSKHADEISEFKNELPKVRIVSTVENLVNSSIQVMIWKHNKDIPIQDLHK